MRTWFVSLLKKINGPAEHQLPRKRKHRRTRIPTSAFPYSVLLPERFSGSAALHLRYPSPGFSRATSIHSPHPVSGRLRVLLLRQACTIPLRKSSAIFNCNPISRTKSSTNHGLIFTSIVPDSSTILCREDISYTNLLLHVCQP